MRIFLILLLLPTFASARLGETLIQCVTRYGEPIGSNEIEPGLLGMTFTSQSFSVGCLFKNGVCISITYTHAQNADNDVKRGFLDTEKEILLGANSKGRKWVETSNDGKMQTWELEGKEVCAVLKRETQTLVFMNIQSAKKVVDDDARKNLKGF